MFVFMKGKGAEAQNPTAFRSSGMAGFDLVSKINKLFFSFLVEFLPQSRKACWTHIVKKVLKQSLS
jgi:hypothetical protein